MSRDCSHNAGFIALPTVPEDVFVAGVIVVTMTQDGTYGTHFVSESIDELPDVSTQLDLGAAIAEAWTVAALTPQDDQS